MKKFIFTLCLLMAAMFLTAQDVPQAINFQAIARDANSEIMANTPIMIQLSILDGAPDGELVYREIRSLTTNAYGSFSFQIGRDPYMAVGEFADIDWGGGRKFLKIDYDPTAMLQFDLSLGTIEFVSVPYAFAAGGVSYIDATGANDGDVLAYNATSGRFEPVAMSSTGGGTYTTPNLSAVLSEGNSANNTTISDLAAPVNANDAATKAYVDALVAQLQAAIEALNPTSTETTGSLNGHDWVDLGLPSGTKWATCNVGASTPTAYGNYYAWGETTTKETYNSSTYTYSGNPTTLPSSADAATANWGTGWRMPTYDELNELKNNCTVTWTTQNGVNGRLFTGPNGNSIFLPAAGYRLDSELNDAGSYGYYWSSSLYTGNPDDAWYLYFTSGSYRMYDDYRYFGQSVRAVCVGTSVGSESTDLPTVTTCEASDITTTGATLSGNVTSAGGATVTACGFLYGTNSSNLSQTVQSGSGTGSFTASLTGLTSGTTYYYKAYATNSAGTAYGEIMSFTTENSGATTGTLYGHDWVDLGLPSGLLWATTNVGAENPEDYGNYYAWGETTTKETYNLNNYRYYDGSSYTKYTGSDGLTALQSSDDAATANWGEDWRMPTETEMYELWYNCAHVWTTKNGVNGCLFTGPNGNSIFLPAAGYRSYNELRYAGSYGRYWGSLDSDYTDWAMYLYFNNSGDCYFGGTNRYYGFSVRPVCVSTSVGSESTDLPTVTTSETSDITTTGATLSGNVTSAGGATVTARGFLYGTNSNNLSQTVQSGSGTGSFTKALTGLTSGTTYYYKAYATNSAGTAYGELMSFTTQTASTSYSEPTGYLNGYGYVDLGLPSGTKWATCNVGASTPTAYGNYYAWGETTTKETYNSSTYTYSDNPTTLPSSADAATANWGAGWRMPTQTEMQELINNCTVTWTTQNGVNGRLFTGSNGNSIFLPAAGYRDGSELYDAGSGGLYWSSSLGSDSTDDAWRLYFNSGNYGMNYRNRGYGLTVRAVCQSQN